MCVSPSRDANLDNVCGPYYVARPCFVGDGYQETLSRETLERVAWGELRLRLTACTLTNCVIGRPESGNCPLDRLIYFRSGLTPALEETHMFSSVLVSFYRKDTLSAGDYKKPVEARLRGASPGRGVQRIACRADLRAGSAFAGACGVAGQRAVGMRRGCGAPLLATRR